MLFVSNFILATLDPNLEKNELVNRIANIIDREIYLNYRFYPCNYVAYDMLNGTNRFADRYTHKESLTFTNYLHSQLAKIPDSDDEKNREFLERCILLMYANPLKNKLVATGQEA